MDDGRGAARRFPPFTMALIALNLAGFLVELWLEARTNFPLEKYGALSLAEINRVTKD